MAVVEWKVGDLVHPKGAAKWVKEQVVSVDDEYVTTSWETKSTGMLQTMRRTHSEMERYCEPW